MDHLSSFVFRSKICDEAPPLLPTIFLRQNKSMKNSIEAKELNESLILNKFSVENWNCLFPSFKTNSYPTCKITRLFFSLSKCIFHIHIFFISKFDVRKSVNKLFLQSFSFFLSFKKVLLDLCELFFSHIQIKRCIA